MPIAKKILALILFFGISSVFSAGSLPDAKYFLSYSAFGGSVDSSVFLEKAEKSKAVVLHLHGCGGQNRWDEELRTFYMETMGYYFIYPNSGVSCKQGANGSYIYTADPRQRIEARVAEVKDSIFWLKNNGFKKIVLTGHSEGGMVAQMTITPVDKTIIHSMGCIRGAREINPVNQTLQLVSKWDPSLGNIPSLSCRDYLNSDKFEVVLSEVKDHGPLADPLWIGKIKEFLNRNN
jgi:predicted esterase